MPRRSHAESLQPRALIAQLGTPTPKMVRDLLAEATTCHKARKHHETGAYIQAAELALRLWLDGFSQRLVISHGVNMAALINGNSAPAPASTWMPAPSHSRDVDQVAAARGYADKSGVWCDNARRYLGEGRTDIPALCAHGHDKTCPLPHQVGHACSCVVPPEKTHEFCSKWGGQ